MTLNNLTATIDALHTVEFCPCAVPAYEASLDAAKEIGAPFEAARAMSLMVLGHNPYTDAAGIIKDLRRFSVIYDVVGLRAAYEVLRYHCYAQMIDGKFYCDDAELLSKADLIIVIEEMATELTVVGTLASR